MSWKFQHKNPHPEGLEDTLRQTDKVLGKTAFEADDVDMAPHADGGVQFDKSWLQPE